MFRLELLTVGEAFRDLIFVGLPHMPRSGEEVRTARFVSTIRGGAVIAATAGARLGLRTAVISGFSRDASRALRRERIRVADLLADDVVEVPCVVNSNGARPLHVGGVVDRVRPLLARVKEDERLTVRAALTQSLDAAREALAISPLVPDRATADRLVRDLSPLW